MDLGNDNDINNINVTSIEQWAKISCVQRFLLESVNFRELLSSV